MSINILQVKLESQWDILVHLDLKDYPETMDHVVSDSSTFNNKTNQNTSKVIRRI